MTLFVTYVTYCIGRDYSSLASVLTYVHNFNVNVIFDVHLVFAFRFEFRQRISGVTSDISFIGNVEVVFG